MSSPDTAIADRPREIREPIRALVVSVCSVVVGAVVVMAIVSVRHAGQPEYGLPAIAVVVVFAASLLALVGAVVVGWTTQPMLALLCSLATLLVVSGILAILSIGLVLLIGAAPVVIAAVRRAQRTSSPGAVLGGIAMTLGLTVGLVVALQQPLVECSKNGVRTSSHTWWGGGGGSSSSGSIVGSADRSISGTVSFGSHGYSYTCRDGHLTAFTKS